MTRTIPHHHLAIQRATGPLRARLHACHPTQHSPPARPAILRTYQEQEKICRGCAEPMEALPRGPDRAGRLGESIPYEASDRCVACGTRPRAREVNEKVSNFENGVASQAAPRPSSRPSFQSQPSCEGVRCLHSAGSSRPAASSACAAVRNVGGAFAQVQLASPHWAVPTLMPEAYRGTLSGQAAA
jgi:hypothetical protein